MPFDIRIHAADSIVEVIYPPLPTAAEVADYLERMKQVIDAQTGPWYCLVDQRRSGQLGPDLLGKVRLTNSYAVLRGMARSARVVADALAAAQANTIVHKSGGRHGLVRTFVDRESALNWLKFG